MKTMKAMALCAFVLMAASAVYGQTKSAIPKFDGTWALDREKSSGLTGALGNAGILMVVTQDAKQITAEQKVVIRNREQPSQELVYKLDGSESEAEVSRPMAGTMKLKARWLEKSKTLELHSVISGENQGQPATISILEQWQLIGDTLRIIRTRKAPQGTTTFKLVFQKQ
jgi:hypothetical protein